MVDMAMADGNRGTYELFAFALLVCQWVITHTYNVMLKNCGRLQSFKVKLCMIMRYKCTTLTHIQHFLCSLPEGGYLVGEPMHDEHHLPRPAAARPARASRLAAGIVLHQVFRLSLVSSTRLHDKVKNGRASFRNCDEVLYIFPCFALRTGSTVNPM